MPPAWNPAAWRTCFDGLAALQQWDGDAWAGAARHGGDAQYSGGWPSPVGQELHGARPPSRRPKSPEQMQADGVRMAESRLSTRSTMHRLGSDSLSQQVALP